LASVTSKSVELDAQDMVKSEYHLRARRQTTVQALVTDLGTFVGQLLVFVSSLLTDLGNALPIILGALGLGGLGLSLDIIVAELAAVVSDISTRKRRGVINLPTFGNLSYSEVVATVNNAQTAAMNINNLTSIAQNLNVASQLNTLTSELNTLNTSLSSASPSFTNIQLQLNAIVANLTAVVGQIQSTTNTLTNAVQSNVVAILQGLAAPVNYVAGLGSTLVTVLTGNGLSAVTLILQNVASAQNATIINLNNFNNALFTISNSTVSLSLSAITQLGNTVSQSLVSCTSKR